jgi:magnesium-transporting ATPase (P-type)
MLTGDKMETAENIAKSCNLIQPNFQVLKYLWREKEPLSIQHYLANLLRKAEKYRSQNQKVSLLVEGEYITPILMDELSARTFIEIAECC